MFMLGISTPSDGIRHLEIQRPDRHNALDIPLYEALALALREASHDPAMRVIVLSSTGKSFCAGNDLADFETAWPQPPKGPVYQFLEALYRVEVPIVAAVQGAAIGIGATMLLLCDVIFAAPQAYLRFPFADLGIVMEGGSSHLLPRLLGQARAMEIVLSGRKVGSEEADRLGLFTGITENPAGTALSFASAVAVKSPIAVRTTKRLSHWSLAPYFPERLEAEIQEINRLIVAKRAAGIPP
jgi:enoyl-CoA hydratase/carnithine racemase